MTTWKVFFSIVLTLIASILFCYHAVSAAETLTPQMAPVNPAFTDFMLHRPLLSSVEENALGQGYIPSPVDRSHLTVGKTALSAIATALPSSYDLRTLGRVTPVRNQGSCGSCWSFGAMASVESSLLPSEPRDFSENNLKNTHGFDWSPCYGGNVDISTAYLMRWSGPVNETDDPYQPNENPSPTGLTVQKHEQNVIYLPLRTSSTTNDAIKNALVTYGAVTVAYYQDDAYYNSTYHTYYFNGSHSSNHEVAIVGWDDNFDKNKFSPAAPGNGAFIIKNSWGTSWGEDGYFYISYYDTSLGYSDLAVFTTPDATTKYSRIYSYDPLGVISGLNFGSNTGWFANVFSAQDNEQIAAVSFYNAALNSPYEVYIYKGLTNLSNPRSGSLAATKTGTLSNAGYLTIPLDAPVSVTSGQVFSVVVKLTTPDYSWPIPVEKVYSGYSSQATASAGQSFASSNGTSWIDTVTVNSTMNVCLKAYAEPITQPATGANLKNVGVFVNGTWYLDLNGNNQWDGTPTDGLFYFGGGLAGAVPVTGDWTGSGTTKIGVVANGAWILDLNGNGQWDGTPTDGLFYFGGGLAGAVPVTGDWTGSGTTKIGVFVNGAWYLDLNGNGQWDGTPTDGLFYFGGGLAGTVPVTGDWTGNGTTKIGVFANGTWYLDVNGNKAWDSTPTDGLYYFGGGLTDAKTITGDWDNAGNSKIGIFIQGSGNWFLDINGNGTWDGTSTESPLNFGGGISGALPVVGKWQ